MSGTLIFEAVTDIDDELIERAQRYRPQKRSTVKVMSGVLAAALVLVIGVFAANALRMGGSKASTTGNLNYNGVQSCDTAVPENVVENMAPAANPEEKELGDTEDMAVGGSVSLEDGKKEWGSSESLTMEKFDESVITVGELYGYVIELKDIVMGEYFIAEYNIYVTKDEESVLISKSSLNEEQKTEVEKLVEEYLLKEGLK